MQIQENKKKIKKEILAVIIVAAVCLIVAAVFVIQYAIRSYNEEKSISELSESLSQKLDDNSKKAEELKGEINPDIVGTYQSKGDISEADPNLAIGAMQLLPDGKVNAKTFGGETFNGWWVSSQKSGVDFVAVGLDDKSDIILYQRSGAFLMNVKSLYYGEVEKAPAFDTTLICESEKGKMTLELDSQGKAKGNFVDTNEESANYGVEFAMKGTYTVDGDFIDIVLNGAGTRFLMFDYDMEDASRDSGMASVYFEKTN